METIQEIAQWVIDNRYPKSENDKVSDAEMYHTLIEAMNQVLRQQLVRQRIIDYTNWLSKQNLMICEGVDGYTFRSSMIGGKKYSAEELYDKFVSEYVA